MFALFLTILHGAGYTPDTRMEDTPFYEQVELSYAITENLSVDLVEICNWRPDFPACEYCGDNEYWNIVWATGFAISQYLANSVAIERLQGKRVLVVGCGVGLESIVLAKLGARVSALDHVAEALRLVEHNCELNDIPPVDTLSLCLHDPESIAKLGLYDVDVIVGGDVHYEPENGKWVKALLQNVLRPQGRAFFADPFREGVEEFFEGLAATEFQIDMHRTEVAWLSDSQEIRIYEIERL